MSFCENDFIQWLSQQTNVGSLKDDMAIIETNNGYTACAVDQIIEKVHFITNEEANLVGRKLLARNLSDVAAMAMKPTKALIALNLANKDNQWLKLFYQGLLALAKQYNIEIIGGDTAAYGQIFSASLTIFATGQSYISRQGAKVGDEIFVTGTLGNSFASQKHLHFTPRLEEGLFLLDYANSMIDLSDGLSEDLWRLCQVAEVGAKINLNQLPLSQNANLKQALNDGEDYELLFTVAPNKVEKLYSHWSFATPLKQIGKIIKKKKIIDTKGEPIIAKGFDHFRKN